MQIQVFDFSKSSIQVLHGCIFKLYTGVRSVHQFLICLHWLFSFNRFIKLMGRIPIQKGMTFQLTCTQLLSAPDILITKCPRVYPYLLRSSPSLFYHPFLSLWDISDLQSKLYHIRLINPNHPPTWIDPSFCKANYPWDLGFLSHFITRKLSFTLSFLPWISLFNNHCNWWFEIRLTNRGVWIRNIPPVY